MSSLSRKVWGQVRGRVRGAIAGGPAPLLVAIVLTGLAACAGQDPRDRDSLIRFKVFEAADRDHDGKLSRDEVEAVPDLEPVARRFDRIDTDHSGLLSWAEVRAARFPQYRVPLVPGATGSRPVDD